MATGTVINDMKIVQLSKTVTPTADSHVMGGYYAFVSLGDELSALFGANWRSRVLAVIPLGAVSTTNSGQGGMLNTYSGSGFTMGVFALNTNSASAHRCDFEVFYR